MCMHLIQVFWTNTSSISVYSASAIAEHHQMDSEVLFRRLSAVSSQRNVSMLNVMSDELAAVPPALFYDDGRMRKNLQSWISQETWGKCVYYLTQQDRQYTSLMVWHYLKSLNESGFQTFNDLGELGVLKKSPYFVIWCARLFLIGTTIQAPSSNKRDTDVEQLRVDQHI